jgi:hypothetical protein
MQTFFNMYSLLVLFQGLFVQSIWLAIGRFARNQYLKDIMSFRSPSSRLSRYYSWRTDSFINVVLEGVMLEFVLVASIIGLLAFMYSIEEFFTQGLIILFIVALTFLSSLQLSWRVREINTAERRLTDSIGPSRDKIGIARDIVENLYAQGEMGDGRVWFALFRLSQRPEPVGWAVRDVLMEKNRLEQEKQKTASTTQDPTEKGVPGPGIQ